MIKKDSDKIFISLLQGKIKNGSKRYKIHFSLKYYITYFPFLGYYINETFIFILKYKNNFSFSFSKDHKNEKPEDDR